MGIPFFGAFQIADINTFRFNLPQPIVGRDDIEIDVDYGPALEDPSKTIAVVWAWLSNFPLKACVLNLVLDCPCDDRPQVKAAVVRQLQMSDDFLGGLHGYLGMLGLDEESRP